MALAIAEEAVFLFGFFIQMALMPAVLLIGFWFLLQVFSEVGSVAGTEGAGVAYMAHIGGFAFGMAMARLFESRHRRLKQGLDA